MPVLWRAAVLSPPFQTLTYELREAFPFTHNHEDAWFVGQRVLVPLGNSIRAAVLLGPQGDSIEVGVQCAPPADVAIKSVIWPLERTPLFSPSYLRMCVQLGLRQACTVGRILGAVLPIGLRSSSVRYTVLAPGTRSSFTPKRLKELPPREAEDLAIHWLEGRMSVKKRHLEVTEYCSVRKDPPWPIRPAAKTQLKILEYLWDRGGALKKNVTEDIGKSAASALMVLVDKGLVEVGDIPEQGTPESVVNFSAKRAFSLNEAQQSALDSLIAGLESPKGETQLLYGVTGSGKTAVYLELAKVCLERGRSVYLLAPELALALNLYKGACAYFDQDAPPKIILYHGYQSPTRREQSVYESAHSGAPVLAIGTRSALFLPTHDPGLIILDEEHDSSFKQDERLNYQAKEIGYFMAQEAKGLLVLGSATPDIKTFYAAQQGVMPMMRLADRAGGGVMPDIDLVDIRHMGATEQLLAPQSVDLVKETVEKGEQAIVMLNRRGYSPLMYCLDCGRTARCRNCEIGLTYHKGRERLVCHYCGDSTPFPLVCDNCGGSGFLPMGEGSEKLEETLSDVLGEETRVLRLDRDSTRRAGRMEEILEAFSRQEAHVLVGTQMLSKGHHFPQVTQVVVADGDLGLNLPDYRAAERTFQLLVQVAGRAGRGELPGKVTIQTRDPDNPCWDFIRRNDYEGFYAQELRLRERRGYPPFTKLGLIRLSYPFNWDEGDGLLRKVTRMARESARTLGVRVLGPAPAPMRMIRGRKRFHCLLKGGDWSAMRTLFCQLCALTPPQSKMRIRLDLDPVDML